MSCHGKPSPPSRSPEWQPVGPNEIWGYVTPSKVTDDQRQMISSTSFIIISLIMVFRVSLVRLIINTLILRPIPHRGLDWQVFYFFYFWYCRTNSVCPKNRVEVVWGKTLTSSALLRSCIFHFVKKCRVYPEILPFLSIQKAQLGSLAEIAISLQIKRPIGRHRSV